MVNLKNLARNGFKVIMFDALKSVQGSLFGHRSRSLLRRNDRTVIRKPQGVMWIYSHCNPWVTSKYFLMTHVAPFTNMV